MAGVLGGAQQPEWPDAARARGGAARLHAMPPLVFAGEARKLRAALAEVAAGRAFLLQAGDCAESFHDDFSGGATRVTIREKLKILLQMAAVLTYGATLPVVKVGRIAGQFVKPRSSPVELVDGGELPSSAATWCTTTRRRRGAHARPRADGPGLPPAAATLNLLRAFTKGGFADLTQVHIWNQEFVASSPRAAATSRSPPRSSARSRSWRRAASTSRASRSSTRSTSGRATRACCSTTRRR